MVGGERTLLRQVPVLHVAHVLFHVVRDALLLDLVRAANVDAAEGTGEKRKVGEKP